MRETGAGRGRTPAPRRKPSREDATELRILEAARAVFLRRGTAGARMQEIAREAGVNQALLHYYFRSKERLSAAVLQQAASRIFPALVQTLTADATLDEKIERLTTIYLDTLSQNLFVPGYLISELHHDADRVHRLLTNAIGTDPANVAPVLLKTLELQIDQSVREGKMRAMTPQQFLINLISLCVFPFAARPMLSIVFGMDDAGFHRFIQQRKKELPDFFRGAIRP